MNIVRSSCIELHRIPLGSTGFHWVLERLKELSLQVVVTCLAAMAPH